ncbi:hypothetical protein M082_6162 [Bacteroides fragilis str. 3725 D9 ii]|nr:hypothetical protein M082_6162 [Bacteroides fragilis str. 3725 D9 ii]
MHLILYLDFGIQKLRHNFICRQFAEKQLFGCILLSISAILLTFHLLAICR